MFQIQTVWYYVTLFLNGQNTAS